MPGIVLEKGRVVSFGVTAGNGVLVVLWPDTPFETDEILSFTLKGGHRVSHLPWQMEPCFGERHGTHGRSAGKLFKIQIPPPKMGDLLVFARMRLNDKYLCGQWAHADQWDDKQAEITHNTPPRRVVHLLSGRVKSVLWESNGKGPLDVYDLAHIWQREPGGSDIMSISYDRLLTATSKKSRNGIFVQVQRNGKWRIEPDPRPPLNVWKPDS